MIDAAGRTAFSLLAIGFPPFVAAAYQASVPDDAASARAGAASASADERQSGAPSHCVRFSATSSSFVVPFSRTAVHVP